MKLEARRPVEDADAVAAFPGEDGLQHRAVAQIGLLGARIAGDLDVHEPGLRIIAVDERIEQRIAVEPRITEPHVASTLIDDLVLEMNRARQAEITQEIMEVVAGAEGLAG